MTTERWLLIVAAVAVAAWYLSRQHTQNAVTLGMAQNQAYGIGVSRNADPNIIATLKL